MKKSHLWQAILLVAIAFGTAWAIRGQFGHEPGAAFAGMIGGAALLLAAARKDWYNKMLPVIAASAIGWGTTGMISYGMVVGYCRAPDLLNASYGYLSLFVIGGLFGLIGGGFVGLALSSVATKRVKWASLLAEMVAGGTIAYYFLIDQSELLMTPPRSEAWAICLGAGAAMVWHMIRNGYTSALRVALYAMLGGGFGFSFGNFLQTTGTVLKIPFNMWNVMEYNIGFWGGSGMAYGVFTSNWPTGSEKPSKYENRFSLLLLLLIIPMLVWKDAFTVTELIKSSFLQNQTSTAQLLSILTLGILLVVIILNLAKLKGKLDYGQGELMTLFVSLFLTYIIWSYLVTGILMGVTRYEQPLYIVNLLLFLLLFRQWGKHFGKPAEELPVPNDHWIYLFVGTIAFIILLSLVSSNYGGLPNGHLRFS